MDSSSQVFAQNNDKLSPPLDWMLISLLFVKINLRDDFKLEVCADPSFK